ncbi:hypothetical protein BSKO_06499 [Bryopsis sp. KO-2023]|nr:hypothetical protein BSKO_06499 [Bryopsis sp. KO-2023]
MGPKKKSKKKLEEELRRKEEEERLAEEERQRQEEEDRIRREEEARVKAEFLEKHLNQEEEVLTSEREKLSAFLESISIERNNAGIKQEEERDWERYLRCTHLPDPRKRNQMNDYLNIVTTTECTDLASTLDMCEDSLQVMNDCMDARLDALQCGSTSAAIEFQNDIVQVQEMAKAKLEDTLAHLIQFCDEFANERGDIQVCKSSPNFRFGIWCNATKNPRLRHIDMSDIQISVEIQKQIALASVGLLVHEHLFDEFFFDCTNEFMAIGGVTHVELIALLPGSKTVKNCTIRSLVPRDQALRRIPYPIPPAGADPATYKSGEPVPPLTFTFPVRSNVSVKASEVKVGWWNEEEKKWSTEGISELIYDDSGRMVTFCSTHMAPLAIIQSRTKLLPYLDWNIRATGGKHGNTAIVTLQVVTGAKLLFEVGPGFVKLQEHPWGDSCGLKGLSMPPRRLLHQLASCGVYLMPEDRDKTYAHGICVKTLETEKSMCDDLALISRAFLISKSKWNTLVGSEECLCRISEVLDWEAGGRTEAKHVERVFNMEKESGDRRVLVIMRRGEKGVAFSPAYDALDEYVDVPGYDTQEYEETVFGEVHASVINLLEGSKGELRDTELGARMKSTMDGVDLAKATNPVFTETMAQFLFALRVFSFG